MRLDEQLTCRVNPTTNRRIKRFDGRERQFLGSVTGIGGQPSHTVQSVLTTLSLPLLLRPPPRKRLPLSNTSRRYGRSGALGCQTWPFKTYALKHATPLRGVSFAESPNASDPYWTLGRAKMPSLNMSVSSQLAALASRSPRSSKLQSAMKLRMTRFRNGQQTRMGSFQDAVLFLRSCNLSRVSRDFRFNCCMLHVPNKDH